jgi:multiple sugar transport system substrate-binding protein
MGGWQWAVSAASTHKKEAKDFVLSITSYDTMKFIMLGGGFSQARLALYDDPDVQKVWTPSASMKVNFQNAFPKFKTIYYPQIQAVVQDQMSAALAGQKSPQDAQTAIADEVVKISGQARSPLVKK